MDDPKFIDGIFNYCDRWCERCYFTSRCRVFEQAGQLTPEAMDISKKKFWDTLSKNLSEAKELLHQAGEKHGFDIEKLTKTEFQEFEKDQKRTRKKIKDRFKDGIDDLKDRAKSKWDSLDDTTKEKLSNTKEVFQERIEDLLSNTSYKAEEAISYLEEKLAELKKQNAKLQK